MRTTVTTAALALAATIGFGVTTAWADDGYGSRHHAREGCGARAHWQGRHDWTTGHYLRHLLKHRMQVQLSDDQVATLRAIHLDLDRTRIKAEAAILVAERELASLLDDHKADLSAIDGKIKQSEALEAGLRLAAIKARREAEAVLTPEQHSKAMALHEEMMERMAGHRHGGASEHEQEGDEQDEGKAGKIAARSL